MNRKDLIAEYDDWFRRKPHKWTSDKRNHFMLNVLSEYPDPGMVLDVGCGNGHTLQALDTQYPDAILYAMDISQEALALTSDKVKGVYTVHSFIDQTSLGLRFDLVLCMGVAEHFENLIGSLERLKSLTGGYCYMEIPNCLSYSPGEETYRRLARGSRQWEWHLTRETWEQHLYAAGFEIVQELVGENPAWEFVWVLE
jgi:SAM-dependent methyltransferase